MVKTAIFLARQKLARPLQYLWCSVHGPPLSERALPEAVRFPLLCRAFALRYGGHPNPVATPVKDNGVLRSNPQAPFFFLARSLHNKA